ncbi:hypothetical protein KI387_029660, partial [Taxus chinensis]
METVMGGEEGKGKGKPLFHDFFSMEICNYKQNEASSRSSGWEEEFYTSSAATRPPVFSLPTCSSQPERLLCGKWEGLGKKRDCLTSYSQNALESSRGFKMSRFDGKDDRRGRVFDDDVHFSMQPPRPTAASHTLVQPSMGVKLELMDSKKWERPIPLNTGPAHERASAHVIRESNLTMEDEGSRTGLKGSSVANLVNDNSASATVDRSTSGQSFSAGRSKFLFDSGVPGPSIPSRYQGAGSAIRQLTIFYGGQAHVFDDVHPSKADAIMALAGSNGRSWYTTYLPRPRSSAVTEGNIASTETEKGGSRMAAIKVSGGNGRKDGSLVSCPSTCSNKGDKE